MLETPYDGADVWDLRNGWVTGANDSSSLYGWRQGGDYGLIGSPGGRRHRPRRLRPLPDVFRRGARVEDHPGRRHVVQASSNDPNLTAYAVLEPNGQLDLMVINKSATSALTGQFQLANFQPASQAQIWQYGEAQDTAQSQTTDGQSALANFATTLTVNGSTFSYSFPAYSMSVLVLGKAGSGVSGPTITGAAARPSPVTGDHRPVGLGDRPGRHREPDLHLDGHRHHAGIRHFQRQPVQRRE